MFYGFFVVELNENKIIEMTIKPPDKWLLCTNYVQWKTVISLQKA